MPLVGIEFAKPNEGVSSVFHAAEHGPLGYFVDHTRGDATLWSLHHEGEQRRAGGRLTVVDPPPVAHQESPGRVEEIQLVGLIVVA